MKMLYRIYREYVLKTAVDVVRKFVRRIFWGFLFEKSKHPELMCSWYKHATGKGLNCWRHYSFRKPWMEISLKWWAGIIKKLLTCFGFTSISNECTILSNGQMFKGIYDNFKIIFSIVLSSCMLLRLKAWLNDQIH